jgi:chromosome segregation ATPase
MEAERVLSNRAWSRDVQNSQQFYKSTIDSYMIRLGNLKNQNSNTTEQHQQLAQQVAELEATLVQVQTQLKDTEGHYRQACETHAASKNRLQGKVSCTMSCIFQDVTLEIREIELEAEATKNNLGLQGASLIRALKCVRQLSKTEKEACTVFQPLISGTALV